MARHDGVVTLRGLCALAGYSRQAYYQECSARQCRGFDQDAVVALVKSYRKVHPRIGVRKLLVLLGEECGELGSCIGRDRLFALLRARNLLVKRRRRGSSTTDSRHGWYTWPNLIGHITPSVISQVWVSDITYLRTGAGFVYLALVMDAYSRKIVGYHLGPSLAAEVCIAALKMALEAMEPGARPIHHSDRGLQYCCREYIGLLKDHGCLVSMTEINHCYENAKAERLNGILKQEYGLSHTFRDKVQAAAAVAQAVKLYNEHRPHTALAYQTPQAVHEAA